MDTTGISKHLDSAVIQLSKLPGIGKRTALRLALNLIKKSPVEVEQLCNSIMKLKTDINHCVICNSITDDEECDICKDFRRDKETVCVVSDIKDIIAIESTMQYRGVYHVLGGIISPIDGIGPRDIAIAQLIERAKTIQIKEIIIALPSTIEGETTSYYIYKLLKEYNITFSQIARGLPIGDELEYADEITLGRSITHRVPYNNSK